MIGIVSYPIFVCMFVGVQGGDIDFVFGCPHTAVLLHIYSSLPRLVIIWAAEQVWKQTPRYDFNLDNPPSRKRFTHVKQKGYLAS